MKKQVFTTLFLLATLLGCKDDDEAFIIEPTHLVAKESDDEGNVTEYFYDSQERLVLVEGTDFKATYNYQLDKVISERVFRVQGVTIDSSTRIFSLQNGLVATAENILSNGDTSLVIFEHRPDSRLERERYFSSNGELNSTVDYEYDAVGNQLKATVTFQNGDVFLVSYEYDGNLQNTLYYGLDIFGKNSPNAVAKETVNFPDGNFGLTEYSYSLDTENRIVGRTSIYSSSFGSTDTTLWTFEYKP